MEEDYIKVDRLEHYAVLPSVLKDQQEPRLYRLHTGDVFTVLQEDAPVRVGDNICGGNGIVARVLFKPKKWWMFWKKKRAYGYEVIWMNKSEI